ncbi:hypothetical protein Tco_1461444 [Tanacetum coccineum]
MTETMEQYMSKTRENYGSGVTRPTINQDTPFELKGQFLKELRDNTFSGSEHEDANEHIEKVLEIVDLFHIPKFLNKYCPPARTAKKMEEINNFQQEPDESLFHAWERFKELLMKCPQHYFTDKQEVILFYNGLDEMVEYSQKWHNRTSSRTRSTETSDGLAAIQAQLNNLGREIKRVNKKVYAAQMSKVLQERGFGSLPSSTETNPLDQVQSILTAKADFSEIRHIGHEPYAVSGTQHRSLFYETVSFLRRLQNFGCDDWREVQDVKILDTYDHSLPQKEKDPRSFTLPCFIHNICFDKALIDLEAKLVFNSVKPTTSIIKRVFVIKSLDSKANFIEEGDESFDLIYGGYI